jgi:hypothetical protein
MESMEPNLQPSSRLAPEAINVRTVAAGASPQNFRFTKPFRIGRVDECEVCIPDEHVSRSHVEVTFEAGQWWIRDLNSSNGIFVGQQRISSLPVRKAANIKLGILGPEVYFEVEERVPPAIPPEPARAASTQVDRDGAHDVSHYVDRYLSDKPLSDEAGERTIMVRRAFAQVKKKQRGKYNWIIACLTLIALTGAGFALYEHHRASKQRETAEAIFYAMKSLDLDIANLQRALAASGTQQGRAEVGQFVSRRKEMEANYDQFLSNLHVYDRVLTPRQKLILRVARIFGECELTMPPNFASEIDIYIKKWQSSSRLVNAINTANQRGYTGPIVKALLAQDLPPQFFYLALQESDFDPYISGPETRKGIAKGMWQFIPETAVKYGLHIGPLAEFPRPDPGDDRHHWERETLAAARYLKDLYSTDAQASGFLVAACYNWGENQVLPLVRSMPLNPRERNFWRLIALYRDKIPQETYDYVFYIASAAVIGEDPRQFGFNFDNPLLAAQDR